MMSMYDELMKARDTIAELEAENRRLKEERNRAVEMVQQLREANQQVLDMLADERLGFMNSNPTPIILQMPPEIAEKYLSDLGIKRAAPDNTRGSYKDARGVFGWQDGDEPAEDTIRRIRGDEGEQPA